MLTVTITNLSSTVAIGAGTAIPLPAPFDWFTIAASGNKAVKCRVSDFEVAFSRLSGFTCADELQRMCQAGLITCTSANAVVAHDDDVYGAAVANET